MIYTVNAPDYFDTKVDEEVEVIKMEDLEKYLQQIGIVTQQSQIAGLKQALVQGQVPGAVELVRLDDLVNLMETLGIQEKKPRSKKHLIFDQLDLKSRRILNRLSKYLEENGLGVHDIFEDII